VFAGLETAAGQLEFFNVDDMNSHGSQQHFMCTTVAGTTRDSRLHHVDSTRDMEHGYIWSFTGDALSVRPQNTQFLFKTQSHSIQSKHFLVKFSTANTLVLYLWSSQQFAL
jgi:hypothetical protein